MKVALCQISPVLLNRERTTEKIVRAIEGAAKDEAEFAVFGETLLPGYPAWIARTDGARFDAAEQKELHALYLDQAVDIERGDLEPITSAARTSGIALCLGIAEREQYSIFASRVIVLSSGEIASVHRKLRPTYEERLTWAPGDGAGLVCHRIGEFTVGALNCWENWMPLARTSLYAQGEDLHCMLWPGARRNTEDLTPVIAKEARSFVVSVSGVLAESDVPADFPSREQFVPRRGEILHDGGSCIAAPDGRWVVAPLESGERVVVADLDLTRVREERQNFDPCGHYARPDVLELTVHRKRTTRVRTQD